MTLTIQNHRIFSEHIVCYSPQDYGDPDTFCITFLFSGRHELRFHYSIKQERDSALLLIDNLLKKEQVAYCINNEMVVEQI